MCGVVSELPAGPFPLLLLLQDSDGHLTFDDLLRMAVEMDTPEYLRATFLAGRAPPRVIMKCRLHRNGKTMGASGTSPPPTWPARARRTRGTPSRCRRRAWLPSWPTVCWSPAWAGVHITGPDVHLPGAWWSPIPATATHPDLPSAEQQEVEATAAECPLLGKAAVSWVEFVGYLSSGEWNSWAQESVVWQVWLPAREPHLRAHLHLRRRTPDPRKGSSQPAPFLPPSSSQPACATPRSSEF